MIVPLLLAFVAQVADTAGIARRVEGRIVLGTRAGPVAVPNQWVVLHALAPSRSGPIDSIRTGAKGQYAFRYSGSPDTATIYFTTTSYGGIVYPTAPFRSPRVSGDDATITVFDTTSKSVALKLAGRHLIIGAQQASGTRPVGEVFDLENDSTVTVIARDSVTPVFSLHIPPNATNFRANAGGSFSAAAMTRSGATVSLFAPVSPGLRQFAFTYDVPSKSFPLSIPAEMPIGVFEVLLEEPLAEVRAPGIREVNPESMDGRTFRRFLAQDVAANTVVSVNVPRVAMAQRQRVYIGIALVFLAAMGVALVFAARRPRVRRAAVVAAAPAPEPRSRVLVRAIAELDDAFGTSETSDDARAQYEARRASLKAELSDALAAERGST